MTTTLGAITGDATISWGLNYPLICPNESMAVIPKNINQIYATVTLEGLHQDRATGFVRNNGPSTFSGVGIFTIIIGY